LFLCAALLFLVQPLLEPMLLPSLGGAPPASLGRSFEDGAPIQERRLYLGFKQR